MSKFNNVNSFFETYTQLNLTPLRRGVLSVLFYEPWIRTSIIHTHTHTHTHTYIYICIYIYIGFKTFFYVVRHLDSIASYLPTGLHLGFFRSWPSLYFPSSFSAVFLVLSFVSASTSVLFWVTSFCHSLNMAVPCKLVLLNFFYNCFL